MYVVQYNHNDLLSNSCLSAIYIHMKKDEWKDDGLEEEEKDK